MLVPRFVRPAVIAVLSAALFLPIVSAQINRATVVGRISDPSGAVVPGATIELVRVEANEKFSTHSTDTGDYAIPNVPEGTYDIRASADGFTTERRTGVKIEIGSTARFDFHLKVGSASTVISVEGAAALLRTDKPETGQVVGNRELVNLPNNSRDFLNMATLVAGVAPSRGSLGDGSLDSKGFNVQGSRRSDNVIYLDGSQISQGNGGTTFFPNIEALEEVEIKTSLYSAEYGIKPGGQISSVTKSGTNALHGTFYEFHMNDNFGARNFFDLVNRPESKRHNFGAVVSGPVLIPKLFNGRDRLWFVFAYQGLRSGSYSSLKGLVPTDAERQGQFSSTIVDPLNSRTPFPNNLIPASRINPVASKLMKFWPQTNYAGTAYNYVSPNSVTSNETNQYIGKIDFAESDMSRWSGRYFWDSTPVISGNVFQTFAFTNPLSTWSQSVSNTRTLSQRLVNEFSAHYFMRAYKLLGISEGQGLENFGSTLGIPGWPQYAADRDGVPIIGISGYVTGIGSGSQAGDVNIGYVEVKDNLNFITGAHSIKAGYHFRRSMNFYLLNTRSAISFTQKYSNNNLSDFLLGLPYSSSLGGETLRGNFSQNGHFMYLQDDWKATSKLTVNLGLRYEYRAPWKDKRGFFSNADPYTAALYPALVSGTLQPWETGRFEANQPVVSWSKNGWQPRVGLAYRLTEKTVVRGGYAIFGNEPPLGWIQYLGQNPRPGSTARSFLSNQTTPTLSLSDPFNTAAQTTSSGLLSIYGIDRNLPQSVVHNWGLSIQRQLDKSTTVEVAYVGKEGIHDFVEYAWNDAVSGTTPRQSRRPFPQYNSFVMVFADGTNSYNGVEFRIQHRSVRTGLNLIGAYTVGKGIDDVGGRLGISNDPGSITRNLPRSANRGLSEANIPGRFSLGFVYEFPFGPGRAFANTGLLSVLCGNWVIDGVLQAQRGPYVTPSITPNSVDSGSSASQRPDVSGNPNLAGENRTIDRWFDTSVFSAPATGVYGNAGRSVIQAPGFVNLDAGLQRIFKATERIRLEFRFEGFNVTNHANFGIPNSTYGSRTFGTISGAMRSRDMQLGLKVKF